MGTQEAETSSGGLYFSQAWGGRYSGAISTKG